MAEAALDPLTFIETLAAAHPHEVEHARHVTALALRLFDALRPRMEWTGNDRLALEAAARLHDIGYADDPADHARASAHRLMRAKPAGFVRSEMQRVAAIMLLHSARPGGDSLLPIPPRLLRGRTVRQLGALLRLADGLDHSHLQDTRITRVAPGERELRVHFISAPFSRNAERARLKADGWSRAFPFVLTLVNKPHPDYALIRPADATGDAIRRLLLVYERRLDEAIRRVAQEDSEEALHELRIALRCLRRLLRAYARVLRDTSAAEAEDRLRKLTGQISHARDLDVGQIILRKHRVQQGMANVPGWDRWLRRQRRQRNQVRAEIRALMVAPATRELTHVMGRLLRIELPDQARSRRSFGEESLRRLADARQGAKACRPLAHSKDPDKLHDLRIAIRRYRLLLDLLAPAMGRPAQRLARRLRAPERKLGRLHDLDVAMARYRKYKDDPVARALVNVLRNLRKRQWSRFLAVWESFHFDDISPLKKALPSRIASSRKKR